MHTDKPADQQNWQINASEQGKSGKPKNHLSSKVIT